MSINGTVRPGFSNYKPPMSSKNAWAVSKELGRGAFGRALLVKRKRDGMAAVMKEISLSGMSRAEQKASHSEAQILRKLGKHPNVVGFIDSFLEEKANKLYIVMEWARAGDLDAIIKKAKRSRMPLSEDRVMSIFIQCAAALDFMHRNRVLHRDIKPANIFMHKQGQQVDIVKLGDFGIAKVLAHTMAKARTVAGTPYYMAPELCRERPYTATADIWSLGCVLHELCALEVPFTAQSLAGLIRKITSSKPKRNQFQHKFSRDLQIIISSMLNKTPHLRISLKNILNMPYVQRHCKGLAESLVEEADRAVRLPAVATGNRARRDVRDGGQRNIKNSLSSDKESQGKFSEAQQNPHRENHKKIAPQKQRQRIRRSKHPRQSRPRDEENLPIVEKGVNKMNNLAERLERLKTDLAKLGGGRNANENCATPMMNHIASAAEAVRKDAHRGYTKPTRQQNRVNAVAAAAAHRRKNQQRNKLPASQPDTDQFRAAAAMKRERQKRIEKQREQRRYVNGISPYVHGGNQLKAVNQDNMNSHDRPPREHKSAESRVACEDKQMQQEQLRARKEARERARVEMLRDRRQFKAKLAEDRRREKIKEEKLREKQLLQEKSNALRAQQRAQRPDWVGIGEDAESCNGAATRPVGGNAGGEGKPTNAHLNADVRRKIWEENQQAKERNRIRARDKITPGEKAFQVDDTSNFTADVNGEVAVQTKASPLDLAARRQIWEENRKARQRNEAAAAAAAEVDANISELEDRKYPLKKQDDVPPKAPTNSDKNAVKAPDANKNKQTEDEYLAQLERARKEAFEQRIRLAEKYKQDDLMSKGTSSKKDGQTNEKFGVHAYTNDNHENDDASSPYPNDGANNIDDMHSSSSNNGAAVGNYPGNVLSVVVEEDDEDDGSAFASLAETFIQMLSAQATSEDKDDGDDTFVVVKSGEDGPSDGSMLLPLSRYFKPSEKDSDADNSVLEFERMIPSRPTDIDLTDPIPAKSNDQKRRRRRRRPRKVELPAEVEFGLNQVPLKAPTPLAECTSALAQLTKDVSTQDKHAGHQRCEVARQALEEILGELTFLRMYRITRLSKQRAGGGTVDDTTVGHLAATLEEMWGKSSQRDGTTAGSIVDKMLGLISMEDAST